MQDCKPVKVPIPVGTKLSADQCPKSQEEIEHMDHVPYANEIGSLMYVMVCTRPYISHLVGVLSRYMSTPGKEHWTTVKRLFKYLCGMPIFAIYYHGNFEEFKVHGFFNSDWDRDIDGR